jgi:hypothetical protein
MNIFYNMYKYHLTQPKRIDRNAQNLAAGHKIIGILATWEVSTACFDFRLRSRECVTGNSWLQLQSFIGVVSALTS